MAQKTAQPPTQKNGKPKPAAPRGPKIVPNPVGPGLPKEVPVPKPKPSKVIRTVDDLTLDEDNANLGTGPGGKMVGRSLDEYGAGRSVLADVNGKLIAGNKTAAKWMESGRKKVIVVDITGDELLVGRRVDLDMRKGSPSEAKARGLAIMDNTSALHDIKLNPIVISEQVKRLKLELPSIGLSEATYGKMDETTDAVEKAMEEAVTVGGKEFTPTETIYELNENALFPSSNEWGIPDLLPDMLATESDIPQWVFGGQKEIRESNGWKPNTPGLFLWTTLGWDKIPDDGTAVMGFYVDDYRFEEVWLRAVELCGKMKSKKWAAVMTPDFSLFGAAPFVMQLWQLYKSRWVGRFWQEAGIRIIPSISWCGKKMYEAHNSTFVKKPEVCSVQVRTGGKDIKQRALHILTINKALEAIQPKHLLIYGGVDHRKWLEREIPKGPVYHWLSSWTTERIIERSKKHKSGALPSKEQMASLVDVD